MTSEDVSNVPPSLGEPFAAGPHAELAGWIDWCAAIDETHLFFSGWLWDPWHRVEDLEVVVDGQDPVSVMGPVSRYPKQALSEQLHPRYGPEADRPHGLLGFVRIPPRFLDLRGLLLRFQLKRDDGARFRFNEPPVFQDPFAIRETMMETLPEERHLDRKLLERHFLPAVEALADRCKKEAPSRIADEIRLGSPTASPPASLLIPVGGNFDLLAPQLALLGQDREIREAELVLLLDAPQDPELTKRQVFDLARLYELSGKAIFVEPRVGYASAINLAAEAAGGDRLVLMHSDTFPERPGWLSPLLGYLDENPDCGLVGPRLLADEATIWSCGWELYDELEFDGLWSPRHRCQGLPRHGESVDQAAAVPAFSAACLVVGRQSFEELGGFTDGYVAGDLEDIDLCLRLRRADRRVRYNPKVDIFHLGGQSRRRGVGWRRNAWADALNRLRLRHRWTEELSSPARDL